MKKIKKVCAPGLMIAVLAAYILPWTAEAWRISTISTSSRKKRLQSAADK